MKIKITETQLKSIKNILVEEVDIVSQFELFCKEKAMEVNSLYSKILNLSIDEILKNEIKLNNLVDYLWNLENVVIRDKRKYVNNFIEGLPDEKAENLDLRVDSANSFVINKIDVLQGILESLVALENSPSGKKVNNVFSDVKPIEIK